jgi:hypothetical protein
MTPLASGIRNIPHRERFRRPAVHARAAARLHAPWDRNDTGETH